MSNLALGPLIRQIREEQGMSQKDLAQQIGMDQGALSKVETGQRSISAKNLMAIEEALGVTIRDHRPLHRQAETVENDLDKKIILRVFDMAPSKKQALWELIKGMDEGSASRERELAPVG